MKNSILGLAISVVFVGISTPLISIAAPMSGDFNDQSVRDWAQNVESDTSIQHDAIIQSQHEIKKIQVESGNQANVIAKNSSAILTAQAEQNKTNQAVSKNSANISDNESRIQTLEANTGNNQNFATLKNEVKKNRQRASAGIAGVGAMANIPQVIQGQSFSVGAGVGTTDGESALAVGFSGRATDHIVVKASVSDDTQQNFVVGAGASYGW